MDNNATYKRRKFLVNRSIQFKIALMTMVLFGIAAFTVWWETYHSLSGLFQRGLIADPEIMNDFHQISRVILIKIIIAFGLVGFLAILISHYFVGPMRRFEKAFELLKEGNLSQRIRVRKFDQLDSIASGFNSALEGLQNKVSRDRAKRDMVLSALVKAEGNKSSLEIKNLIKDLNEISKDFTI